MKSKTLKLIITILLAVVTMAAFSACNKNATPPARHEIVIEENEGGEVSANKKVAVAGETITLTVTANFGNVFKDVALNGQSLTLVNGRATFIMPNAAANITAQFENFVKVCDENGASDKNGNYVLFGEYPSTIACDNAVLQMSEVPNARGYFVSAYDGAQYQKIKGIVKGINGQKNGYKFSNGEPVDEKDYYFKVERIMWRILSHDGDNLTLLCCNVLDTHVFCEKAGASPQNADWENSDIRKWLGGGGEADDTFYNKAFSDMQKDIIVDTALDNKTTACGGKDNSFAQALNNTVDKIFLPSFSDMTNKDYGFKAFDPNNHNKKDAARRLVANDFSRAKNVVKVGNGVDDGYGDDGDYSNFASWWVRSPGVERALDASTISGSGIASIYGDVTDKTNFGVVPMLVISMRYLR